MDFTQNTNLINSLKMLYFFRAVGFRRKLVQWLHYRMSHFKLMEYSIKMFKAEYFHVAFVPNLSVCF